MWTELPSNAPTEKLLTAVVTTPARFARNVSRCELGNGNWFNLNWVNTTSSVEMLQANGHVCPELITGARPPPLSSDPPLVLTPTTRRESVQYPNSPLFTPSWFAITQSVGLGGIDVMSHTARHWLFEHSDSVGHALVAQNVP